MANQSLQGNVYRTSESSKALSKEKITKIGNSDSYCEGGRADQMKKVRVQVSVSRVRKPVFVVPREITTKGRAKRLQKKSGQ